MNTVLIENRNGEILESPEYAGMMDILDILRADYGVDFVHTNWISLVTGEPVSVGDEITIAIKNTGLAQIGKTTTHGDKVYGRVPSQQTSSPVAKPVRALPVAYFVPAPKPETD